MVDGLDTTLKCLSRTPNEAALDLLVAALDSNHQAIRDGALRSLLKRRNTAGHREILQRWNGAGDHWKSIIAESPGKLSGVMRDAMLAADLHMCQNACDAALDLHEYDLIPALINATEDGANVNADLAAATLLQLAERLYHDLAKSHSSRRGRDPQLVRSTCLSALEASVQRYGKHQRQEILEAFLILVSRENATLKRILQNPHDRSYLPLVNLLTTSERPGIIRLVLSFLNDPHSPNATLQLISRRTDPVFLHHLFAKIGFEPAAAAKVNLRRMTSFPWLRGDLHHLEQLNEQQQHAVVEIVKTSGMNRQQAFEVIQHLARRGKVAGRRAATAALADIQGAEANEVALICLNDEDDQVRANVLMQLRERRVPGAMSFLLEAIESPETVIREAARTCLGEFHIDRYLSAFDMLEDEVRLSTGRLVYKVDPHVVPRLEEELKARGRGRRIRAIAAANAMGAVAPLEAQVIELLSDEDHFVRVEAAAALASCGSDASRQALREALLDRSVAVQEAAQSSLNQLASSPPPLPPGSDVPAPAVDRPWESA